MDQTPLVREEIDTAAEFLARFHNSFPIEVAFWLRHFDAETRYLYVVPEGGERSKLDGAYGEVIRLWSDMDSPWFDAFRVRVVTPDTSAARAALELRHQSATDQAIRLTACRFGDSLAGDVYIYPAFQANTAAVPA